MFFALKVPGIIFLRLLGYLLSLESEGFSNWVCCFFNLARSYAFLYDLSSSSFL